MSFVDRGQQSRTASADADGSSDVPAVEIVELTKSFGPVTAVQPLSLEIHENEFFSILGPSGCGKTTLMRAITGFEKPTAGRVLLSGVDVTNTPTRHRDLNMLFQSYALFPHLSVFENVAFELRVRKIPKRDVTARTQAALDLVRLGDFANRKPDQLSGGQRQRVALARAVVSGPKVVLLDEPLGALDQQLRKEMQFELKRMQREVGITFIYVTHDQEEALTMSDRIAVMSDGVVQQVASPEDVYNKPATRFVAGFIGRCNLVDVIAPSGTKDAVVAVELPGAGHVEATLAESISEPTPGTLLIRPERIELRRDGDGAPATINSLTFLGQEWQVRVTAGAQELKLSIPSIVAEQNIRGFGPGETLRLSWRPQDARIVFS